MWRPDALEFSRDRQYLVISLEANVFCIEASNIDRTETAALFETSRTGEGCGYERKEAGESF